MKIEESQENFKEDMQITLSLGMIIKKIKEKRKEKFHHYQCWLVEWQAEVLVFIF